MPPIRLVAVGDSITAGFAPATYGWTVPLASLNGSADFGVKNVAVPGHKVADAATVFGKEVRGRGATHVAFLIGTNDLPDGTSAATIYAAINGMATVAEAEGAHVLLLGLLPRGTGASFTAARERTRLDLNALLAARAGSTYVDTDRALREPPDGDTGTAWAPSTAYNVNDTRVNGGNAYICLTAGTSAGSGGPSGTDTATIVDGGAEWVYVARLATAAGGATDGLHPSNAGQALIATEVNDTAQVAGLW